MADNDGNITAKDYGVGIAPKMNTFPIKGADHLDWGMKTRLAKIFSPADGKTVMLAFDHGYIMGSTSGLERLDLTIPQLMPHADALMATRGALRTCIPPTHGKGIALRCTADSSVLKDDMSLGVPGVHITDAIRINASCLAVQVFIGSANEVNSLDTLVKTIDAGLSYGIPTLGVVAVGKEMERTSKYFLLATRMIAELGAQIIKTYYCEDFEKVAAACPVPLVVAGGKKLPEQEALEMTYRAIQSGAAGVDMGRNIFQAENPVAMIQAVRSIVHEGNSPAQAYQMYLSLK